MIKTTREEDFLDSMLLGDYSDGQTGSTIDSTGRG